MDEGSGGSSKYDMGTGLKPFFGMVKVVSTVEISTIIINTLRTIYDDVRNYRIMSRTIFYVIII